MADAQEEINKDRYGLVYPSSVSIVPEGSQNTRWLDMVTTFAKLEKQMLLEYPAGLPAEMVAAHPELERFVCYSCIIGGGISKNQPTSKQKDGGMKELSPSQTYFKVHGAKNMGNKMYQTHKLSACIDRRVIYETLDKSIYDTSHLCHNHQCWRPSHLTFEVHKENTARGGGSGCGAFVYLVGRNEMYDTCSHQPKCQIIRVVKLSDLVIEKK
jgi:hypothetical protein